jgi:hypothetical protein
MCVQTLFRQFGRKIDPSRITQYRAVGERDGDTIAWAWIGSHNEFDGKFGRG